MLEIIIERTELLDTKKSEFIYIPKTILRLEHSLISISKWESKWHKPFLSDSPKSYIETIDYIKFMTINTNVDPNVYICLTSEHMKAIDDYMSDSMTATWFSEDKKKQSSVITAEIIYWQMISLGIPLEWEKRHLNRLLTLIKVCNLKNAPQKKMSKEEIMRRNAQTNAARRRAYKSRG